MSGYDGAITGRGGFAGYKSRGRRGNNGEKLYNNSQNDPRNPSTAQWVDTILQAIKKKNGEKLAELLKNQCVYINPNEIRLMPENVMNGIITTKLRNASLAGKNDSNLRKLILEYLRLYQSQVKNGKHCDIVKQCTTILDIYIELYSDLSTLTFTFSCLVPGMAVLCNLMNKVAFAADAEEGEIADMTYDEEIGDNDETQNKCTKEILNAIRPKLGKVRGDETGHGAYVLLLGQSIKACLQLGNMQMAAGFLKLYDSRHINFHRVPRGPIVNFRYFLGKLYMQQEQFEKAESELVWAYSNCPKEKFKIRQNILECLAAVRLRMGVLPPIGLMKKYDMDHIVKIVSAIKSGNVSDFLKTMELYQRVFIRHGTILCIERVVFIVYRTLIKRARAWYLKSGLVSKPNFVPVKILYSAFKWQCDEYFDENEMACIIANLIKMGYIKGYISWGHMIVVFSNQDPFPRIKMARIAQ